ncbi:hypothetical protein EDD16DRAFT_434418 [Pisolithus croceorrhizus]|nr:hypothetical protein EDD16DRAFT_434418 [Pisolithus croceorrhizus]
MGTGFIGAQRYDPRNTSGKVPSAHDYLTIPLDTPQHMSAPPFEFCGLLSGPKPVPPRARARTLVAAGRHHKLYARTHNDYQVTPWWLARFWNRRGSWYGHASKCHPDAVILIIQPIRNWGDGCIPSHDIISEHVPKHNSNLYRSRDDNTHSEPSEDLTSNPGQATCSYRSAPVDPLGADTSAVPYRRPPRPNPAQCCYPVFSFERRR